MYLSNHEDIVIQNDLSHNLPLWLRISPIFRVENSQWMLWLLFERRTKGPIQVVISFLMNLPDKFRHCNMWFIKNPEESNYYFSNQFLLQIHPEICPQWLVWMVRESEIVEKIKIAVNVTRKVDRIRKKVQAQLKSTRSTYVLFIHSIYEIMVMNHFKIKISLLKSDSTISKTMIFC